VKVFLGSNPSHESGVPTMDLTDEQIRRLARLARLELSDQELSTIGPQLQRIVHFVDQLAEVDVSQVKPMATALETFNRWEADQPRPGLSVEEALANAPKRDEECFLVPPVLGR
jgi:aspartyl-tRNA(Asn)/glutamyl-tRNA(Gln) amidotransferase subunit C